MTLPQFAEGARWVCARCNAGRIVWVLFLAAAPFGMVFHRGADLEWCAHRRGTGTVRTGLGFGAAIAIVEHAAMNVEHAANISAMNALDDARPAKL